MIEPLDDLLDLIVLVVGFGVWEQRWRARGLHIASGSLSDRSACIFIAGAIGVVPGWTRIVQTER